MGVAEATERGLGGVVSVGEPYAIKRWRWQALA